MDRKNRKRVTYVSSANATLRAYGMKPEVKKKKKKPFQGALRIALLVIAVAALVAVVLSVSLSNVGRTEIGRATRIGATLSQNVTPFGDKVIFYDGTTLHCVAATGGNEWSYQIGNGADYDATESRIVAWTGNDIYILNTNGRLVYNNKMSDKIQFASAGDNYVAVFVGEPDNGVVTAIDQNAAGYRLLLFHHLVKRAADGTDVGAGTGYDRHGDFHRAADVPAGQAVHGQELAGRAHRLHDLWP